MSKTILVTGASGLIGKPLTRLLLQKGYTVFQLSRHPREHGNPKLRSFKWDIDKREIDEECITGVDAIIHLAGESIAGKRWTRSRKQKIIQSRTQSVAILYDLLRRSPGHQVKTIISASAIGYYGDREDELLIESSSAGDGFLSQTCIEWEKAADEGKSLGLRVVKLRTGMILSEAGGALPEIARPVKMGLGAVLGSGKQWVSWIHLMDAIRMYLFALENPDLEDVYNMVSPNPVTNYELTHTLAKVLDKKIWLPKVPAFSLKLLMGEMSRLVLDSAKVSPAKIISKGFTFEFRDLEKALKDIYNE